MHPSRRTWRVRGVPLDFDSEQLANVLKHHPDLQCSEVTAGSDDGGSRDNDIRVHTLSLDTRLHQVATVRFSSLPPKLGILGERGQLTIEIRGNADNLSTYPGKDRMSRQTVRVTIDEHFHGITVLHSPVAQRHEVDILAIPGLGGHPFGSFTHKWDGHMWLSDRLPQDIPTARVMIYGYESKTQNSINFSHLEDLAGSLQITLGRLLRSKERKRLILIGHSLGGLLVKECLIRITESDSELALFDLITGILFFGVPNDGMDIESLIPMVNNQPNRLLVDSLDAINPQILRLQRRNFSKVLERNSLEIFCFYETLLSPTAAKVGRHLFAMKGKSA
jgi:hypothetical protein